MSLQLLELDNDSFSQELGDTFQQDTSDIEFAGTRKGMRRKTARRAYKQTTLRRVSKRQPKGRVVYGKSGRRLTGVYIKKTRRR